MRNCRILNEFLSNCSIDDIFLSRNSICLKAQRIQRNGNISFKRYRLWYEISNFLQHARMHTYIILKTTLLGSFEDVICFLESVLIYYTIFWRHDHENNRLHSRMHRLIQVYRLGNGVLAHCEFGRIYDKIVWSKS